MKLKNITTKVYRCYMIILFALLIVPNFQGCSKETDNTEIMNKKQIYEAVQKPDGIEIILKGKHSVRHYKDKFIKISQKIYFVYLFFRVSGTNVPDLQTKQEEARKSMASMNSEMTSEQVRTSKQPMTSSTAQCRASALPATRWTKQEDCTSPRQEDMMQGQAASQVKTS